MTNLNQIKHSSKNNLSTLNELTLGSLKGLFDVDGVFSAPHRKTALPEREIVNQWVTAIRQGLEGSLATGRPGIWITQDLGVLGLARTAIGADSTTLQRLKSVPHFAENGAVVLKAEGERFVESVVNDKFRFPRRFENLARRLVNEHGISDFAEFDPSKRCVVSIYVNKEGFGQSDLEPHKDSIAASFRSFIEVNQMPWVVAKTAIAIDAYHKDVNKELAVKGFLEDLQIPGTQPDIGLIAVGDSPSDYALYTGLENARSDGRLPKGAKLWFVFTGTEAGLEELLKKHPTAANSPEFIFAGVLGDSQKVEVYSDATKVFLDRLLIR